ncbi:TPA: prepilin-type N-terminal cleavage/methylation domain-containing protein [Enterobacter cloacae]|nr:MULTISPECIES: prepilin-type N-terminal cleavage/methylation domain-containing protein [Enterobacter]HAS0888291.1 prepilin-type N-terminal cleavage/methylation domain-containing protein [Enterobacter cloacae subsp. cloacae]EKM5720713.1 prepilin-type N-terminal cleavage/methylation domain-containing protein [Enterobacter cloacae]EKP1127932.1 prepilin-type N-terminal cleavage/methylation domain-containing protein [Enterobacter cloacae]EKU2771972.1 prepilin-type N-terminal cleavage/methylation d
MNRQQGFTLIELMVMINSKLLFFRQRKSITI